MASKAIGKRKFFDPNEKFTGRNARNVPKDPVRRLFERSIGGSHRHQRINLARNFFHKLPGRLGFYLRSLVDESVLHDGHVFLGFTKSGQFLLSYTLTVETDEHTTYPGYVYRLQWWRFVPYKRLRKIAEVRLFGEEDIQQELTMSVCEWPTDPTRVLIHGYWVPRDNEKHQCYVTITAVPPVASCEDCNQLAILHMQSGYHSSNPSAPPRCINHAFTVHTKYELAPPYPAFVAIIYLKLDGVVVINTGDSLIAMSVDIEDNHGGFGFGLYSPRVARSMSTLSSISSPSEDQMSCDSHDRYSEQDRESLNPILSPSCPHLIRNPATPKDATNTSSGEYRMPERIKERHMSTGKENLMTRSMGSPPSMLDGRHDLPPPSRVQRNMDVYNFEASTPKKDEDNSDLDVETQTTSTKLKSDTTGSHAKVGLYFNSTTGKVTNNSNTSLPEISLLPNSDTLCVDTNTNSDADLFEKPTSIPRLQTNSAPARAFTSLSLVSSDTFSLLSKGLCSPGHGKFDTASSTCSSCISSPIILQSDSQCFTYSVRRFQDSFGLDAPADVEDDLNLAYHSVLPLEVHGANYSHMRLMTKVCNAPQMPCVVVKQLTLDIEHYLGETVRNKAEWGHRYMSFTDYDVQIIEVCPVSQEVVAMVYVLIRARPPRDKHVHGMRHIPKLYQSSFKLVWNLKTGAYSTLDIEDLIEVNQAELARRKNSWNPGNRILETTQRKLALPQVHSRSVHVLCNDNVMRGRSLKMILDRFNYVAVLL